MRVMDKRLERHHRSASAKELKINGDERRPNGRRESKKKAPAHEKQRSGHSFGWTGHNLKACLMSTLAMYGFGPASSTSSTASSNEQYFMENSSISIHSFTDPAWLLERSRIRRNEPSFFATMPIGDVWQGWNGGSRKGP